MDRAESTMREAPEGAVAWIHANPIDNGGWCYDDDEANRIELEDPSLVEWVQS